MEFQTFCIPGNDILYGGGQNSSGIAQCRYRSTGTPNYNPLDLWPRIPHNHMFAVKKILIFIVRYSILQENIQKNIYFQNILQRSNFNIIHQPLFPFNMSLRNCVSNQNWAYIFRALSKNYQRISYFKFKNYINISVC